MIRFVNNNTQNNLLNAIYEYIEDSESLTIDELRRYKKEFPFESDYNIAQYGNLIIGHYEVRKLLQKCGYKHAMDVNKSNEYIVSDDEIWKLYKSKVKIVVDYILMA